jgi:hypothetical protein
MGSRPPSRTTASGRLPNSSGVARSRARRACGRPVWSRQTPRHDGTGRDTPGRNIPRRDNVIPHASLAAILLLSAILAFVSWSLAGCAGEIAPLARAGDRLENDAVLSADLDGDGVGERVLVEGASRRLIIDDGKDRYRSREKWWVAEACLGDTDGNGLLEVVALLDDPRGRHLGLIAYMGDGYRERLVTSVLSPRPLSLQVVPGHDGAAAADLIVLKEESASSVNGVQTTTYRWNGFGFTALRPSTP